MKKILIFILGILLLSGLAYALTTTQTVTVTVLAGGIDIYSPIQSNVYNQRMIPINLSMSTEVDYFRYSDNDNKPVTLCRNCDEYGFSRVMRKPFDDGFHRVIFMALFGKGGGIYEQRDFFVDTKKPKITKTEPKKSSADGTFYVEFQEANPISLILNYGNSEIGIKEAEVNLENCYEVRRNIQRCLVNANLKDYDLQKINYWFNITDILENKDGSKPKEIGVCLFPCEQSFLIK